MKWHVAAVLLMGLLSSCVPDLGWRAPAPAPAAPGAPAYEVSLLGVGPMIIPPGVQVDGLNVGGLSAVSRVKGDTYLALVDNEGDTPARIFELEFRVTEIGPVPPPGRTEAEVPRSALRLAGLTGKTLDAEGMVLLPGGGFLVSSEKEPSIREISAKGETLRLLPVPPLFEFSAIGGSGVRINAGFEPLALSPDGRSLWTGNEGALKQDAPDDARFGTHPVRLLRYERKGRAFEPAEQYVYVVEPIRERRPGFSVRGLVELLVLPEGGLLALEREFVEGVGTAVQLFHVEIGGATDVSGLPSLAGQSYTPVRKTLLFDVNKAGFWVDNLEGMTLGPKLPDGDRTLVLIADDNFERIKQFQQVLALRLHSATRAGS